MTEYELVYTTFAAIMVAVVFSFGVVWILGGFFETQIQSKVTAEDLNRVTAARMVEDCLKQGGSSISADFLASKNSVGICETCKAACDRAGVKNAWVEDTVTAVKWQFSSVGTGSPSATLFTNIQNGSQIHMGRLNVDV